jgi:hypothetical protein
MPGIAGAATTRALISVSVSDEIRDMPGNYGVPIDRPITSHHGLAVSNNWAELLDGSIDQNLASSGVLPSGAFWYSGSLENGSAAITTCSGWTDGSSPFGGRYGSSSFADGRWIDTGDATCGSQLYHVLCLAWD